AAFEAEYPFLKVDVLTGGPQTLLNRILTETRAGKYNFDTMNVRSSALYTLKKAGAVMRYESPNRRALRAGFADQDGYSNGLWARISLQHEAGVPSAGAEIDRRPAAAEMERQARHGPGRRRLARGGHGLLRRRARQRDRPRSGRAAAERPQGAEPRLAARRRGRIPATDRRASSRGRGPQEGRRADRLRFSRAFRAGESGFDVCAVVAPAASARRGAAGGFHDLEKRPGDRIPAKPVARL